MASLIKIDVETAANGYINGAPFLEMICVCVVCVYVYKAFCGYTADANSTSKLFYFAIYRRQPEN